MKFENIQNSFFFAFLILATLLFFWLMNSFMYTIFWAIFLSIIFYPLYKKILKKTKNKKDLSASITIVLIFLIILLPISFTTYLIIDEIPQINKIILEQKNNKDILSSIPFKSEINNTLTKYNINIQKLEKDSLKSVQNSLNNFTKNVLNLGKNTLGLIINFFIMLYILYFGIRDGDKFLKRLSEILPLGNRTEKKLFDHFSSIIRSIFKGTLIVALIQGGLAGLLFYLVGIKEGILIWTLLLILSAMIPAVGTGLIIIPSIIYMIIVGELWIAIILTVGLLFISTIDTFIRPHLIGKETEMPDMLITISILGGLSLLGPTGLVIGPVIAGFFLTMWKLFEEKFKKELKNN